MADFNAQDTGTGNLDPIPPTLPRGAKRHWIDERLPNYNNLSSEWQFFEQSYNGGVAYFNRDNIWSWIKEDVKELEDRMKRLYRLNYCKQVVDLLNSYLFRDPPTRQVDKLVGASAARGAEVLKEYWADVSNNPNQPLPIDDFMKNVGVWSSVEGIVYVVTDKPGIEVNTVYQETQVGVLPYSYMVMPYNVLDLKILNGRIVWILILEEYREDDDPHQPDRGVKQQYRLWTETGWELWRSNPKGKSTTTPNVKNRYIMVDSGEHNLGICPVVRFTHEKNPMAKYASPSYIQDIAYVDRAIFNNCSRLDQILNDQTFSQMISPFDSIVPEADMSQYQSDGIIPESAQIINNLQRRYANVLSTKRVMFYDSNTAGQKPEFISPDASQAMLVLRTIQMLIEELFKNAHMTSEIASATQDVSGETKSYEGAKLQAMLANKADVFETAEAQLCRIVLAWRGIKQLVVEKGIVDYPESFQVDSLLSAIETAKELAILQISATFYKEVNKKLVLRVFPKMPDATRDIIFKEIDDQTPEDLVNMVQNLRGVRAEGQDNPNADGKPTGEKLLNRPGNLGAKGGTTGNPGDLHGPGNSDPHGSPYSYAPGAVKSKLSTGSRVPSTKRGLAPGGTSVERKN